MFRQIIKVKNFYIWRTFDSTHVHYVEVFFTSRTENRVHCSELGGVHYIEVCLQQKSIGGTETCVQIGGIHYIEVFTNGGFTVYVSECGSERKREMYCFSFSSQNDLYHYWIGYSLFSSHLIPYRPLLHSFFV